MCSCLEGIAKVFLLVTNLIICLLSLVMIGLSIWVLVDSPSFTDFLEVINAEMPIYRTGVILLIVLCCIIFIVTFVGCCGASKENRCLLGTYSVSVLIIIVLTITAAVLTLNGNLEVLKDPFYKSLESYDPHSSNSNDKEIVQAWDSIQQDLQCCGVDSWKDWESLNENFGHSISDYPNNNKNKKSNKNDDDDDDDDDGKSSSRNSKSKNSRDENDRSRSSRPNFNNGGNNNNGQDPAADNWLNPDFGNLAEPNPRVPESCCDPSGDEEICSYKATTSSGLYMRGCLTAIEDTIVANAQVVGGIAVGVILFLILNFGISTYMCCVIGSHPEPEPRHKRRHKGKNYGPTASVDVY